MKAVLLAAGRGKRLGELSEHTPKPMIKIAGRPVIEHNLRWLATHGVTEVAINLHHLGDAIESYVGSGHAFGVHVHYHREPELLGTAGALKPFETFLSGGPFVVAYGDNLFDFDLGKLIEAHANNAGVATLALFDPAIHTNTGVAGGRVEMDRAGRVIRFVEGREDVGLRLVNAGCYVVEPSLLLHIPEGQAMDFGHDLFPLVLRNQGILGGHLIDGWCLGLDTPAALARARRICEQKTLEDHA